MDNTAISIRGLAKRYRLGVVGSGWLAKDLQSWWARSLGREDPNAKLGAEGLSGEIMALDDVSFDVPRGQVVGVIGRNGAGKSTLLKILTRVTAPSAGEAVINGCLSSLLEVGTGFHPELTGRENVFLNGCLLGMTRAEVASKFDEIVEFAGLAQFVDTPVKRYSSGMYVRLAFSVAAHLEPDIMLVDEVLAVGDVEFQRKCLGRMGEVARGGRTILFVSHNMSAIRSLCDRAVVLDAGRLVFDGDVDKALDHYLGFTTTSEARVDGERLEKCANHWLADGEEEYFSCGHISLAGPDGQGRTEFSSDEEVTVEVGYELKRPTPDFNILVHVINDRDEAIVRSESLDAGDAGDPVPGPGRYLSRVTFPANMFGERDFKLTVSLQRHGKHHLAFRRVLGFSITFAGYNHRSYTQHGRSGAYIRPRLEWTTSSAGDIE